MGKTGFTLIELLVVVAIIGILAAVGVVAYNGYTGAAKKNASKANFSTVIKYIENELMKCELDSETKILEGLVDCKVRAAVIAQNASERDFKQHFGYSLIPVLKNLKNPYKPNDNAFSFRNLCDKDSMVGYVCMNHGGLVGLISGLKFVMKHHVLHMVAVTLQEILSINYMQR